MSTRTRAKVHDALPTLLPQAFPGFAEEAPLKIPALSEKVERQLVDLFVSPDFDAWSQALARVGNCANPIQLLGRSQTIDTTTGEIVSSYSSEHEPLGVTFVRCGNRRASECPYCSRVYAADMFQLIRAGIAGGKTVPESVADNPLVSATVTAPSFGHVHGTRDGGRRCRPHTRGPARCQHGAPRTCHRVHAEDDPALGQPLCSDCYDYESHVVWQWWAPDQWRRFTIALRRLTAKALGIPSSRLHEVATVQYAKVAEYQLRGLIHFHSLIRLDGPRTRDGFAAAPASIGADLLADLVQQAAVSVRLTVSGVDADDPSRLLAFGRQLDARVVRTSRRTDDPGRSLAPETGRRLSREVRHQVRRRHRRNQQRPSRRIRATVRTLSERAAIHRKQSGDESYELLGKWVQMLGFRGHFATNSRRYSVTLGALRRARRRAQALIAEAGASGRPLDLAALEADLLAEDDCEATLVVGQWHFVGAGWANEGQTVLARAAAARAREYDQWRAEERKRQRTSGDRTR